MKTFIINVSKNKKWITLGLSILYLVLFFFPLDNIKLKNGQFDGFLPFIIWVPYSMFNITYDQATQSYLNNKLNIAVYVIYTALLIACLVLAIISVVRNFKCKKFNFTWSLVCAVLVMFLQGIGFLMDDIDANTVKLSTNFCFTFYIFLVLLVLDVVYLILEKHYLKPTDSGQ
ncbi:MAG: hypothetical protein K2K85_03755 [Clostridia bacterium]|nr:hypothetical protein [Clostridia bacterium]